MSVDDMVCVALIGYIIVGLLALEDMLGTAALCDEELGTYEKVMIVVLWPMYLVILIIAIVAHRKEQEGKGEEE